MKTYKFCKHGHNYCDNKGFCTYCYLGTAMGKYPVRKEQTDCCKDFEPDEDDDED